MTFTPATLLVVLGFVAIDFTPSAIHPFWRSAIALIRPSAGHFALISAMSFVPVGTFIRTSGITFRGKRTTRGSFGVGSTGIRVTMGGLKISFRSTKRELPNGSYSPPGVRTVRHRRRRCHPRRIHPTKGPNDEKRVGFKERDIPHNHFGPCLEGLGHRPYAGRQMCCPGLRMLMRLEQARVSSLTSDESALTTSVGKRPSAPPRAMLSTERSEDCKSWLGLVCCTSVSSPEVHCYDRRTIMGAAKAAS